MSLSYLTYKIILPLIWTKLVIFLLLAISVAIITLLERKLIGYMHIRIRVNKNSFIGLLQPILDAIKLLLKELIIPEWSLKILYLAIPIIIILTYFIISELASILYLDQNGYSILWFISIITWNIYYIIWSGYFSIRKYAYLASIRYISIIISIELIFILIWICLIRIINIIAFELYTILLPIFIIWAFLIIIELGRSPIDIFEAESELIRGFNIEFRSIIFILIFLAEYIAIFIFSIISRTLLGITNWFVFIIVLLLLIIRGIYVRIRIDLIITITWYHILPIISSILLVISRT